MCAFLSLVLSEDAKTVHIGDLRSHSGTRNMLGLETDYGRELEWTRDDDGESLSIRVPANHRRDEVWYRERILRRWPSRPDLIRWCLEQITKEEWSWPLDLGGCTGLTALPDGLSVGGSLYLPENLRQPA